jgi:putative NIF3 family GTP cyclohydrolase 1 type 2
VEAAELVSGLSELLGRVPLVQGAGPERIHAIGVLTGSGASALGEAIGLGLDALITGEAAEHAMSEATEGDVHFLAAGHYATETLGIRRLGERVADHFGIEHRFVDLPNPV